MGLGVWVYTVRPRLAKVTQRDPVSLPHPQKQKQQQQTQKTSKPFFLSIFLISRRYFSILSRRNFTFRPAIHQEFNLFLMLLELKFSSWLIGICWKDISSAALQCHISFFFHISNIYVLLFPQKLMSWKLGLQGKVVRPLRGRDSLRGCYWSQSDSCLLSQCGLSCFSYNKYHLQWCSTFPRGWQHPCYVRLLVFKTISWTSYRSKYPAQDWGCPPW